MRPRSRASASQILYSRQTGRPWFTPQKWHTISCFTLRTDPALPVLARRSPAPDSIFQPSLILRAEALPSKIIHCPQVRLTARLLAFSAGIGDSDCSMGHIFAFAFREPG